MLKCKSFQLEVSGCQKLFAIYFDVVKNFWPVFYRKLMKKVTCEIFISQKRFKQFLGSCIPSTNTKIQGKKELQNLLNASEALSLWTDFQQIKTYFSCFLFSKLKPKRETPASRERMPAKMPGLASFSPVCGS